MRGDARGALRRGRRRVYNIIHEQELLKTGDQLVAYLAQQGTVKLTSPGHTRAG